MNASITFYTIAIILVLVSFVKDKQKTKFALIKAYKSFMGLMPSLIAMVIFVGLLLTFVSPNTIGKAMMPGFIAFPLGANLLKAGAGYAQVAGFLGTLMAVGVSTIFLEMKFFKKKTTIYRNILAFIGSIVFAIVIGMVM